MFICSFITAFSRPVYFNKLGSIGKSWLVLYFHRSLLLTENLLPAKVCNLRYLISTYFTYSLNSVLEKSYFDKGPLSVLFDYNFRNGLLPIPSCM